MISKEKILKLFKNFVGGSIDLHGLKCIPVGVGDPINANWHPNPSTPIIFKIENPNNVSYFYTIVYEELYDITREFSDYINIKLKPILTLGDLPNLFLNYEVRNKIQKVFDSVIEIKFSSGKFLNVYDDYVINIQPVGIKLQYSIDNDNFHILNTVVPLSATKNGENIDVSEVVYEYLKNYLPNQEKYYETEKYYLEIDQILDDYPLLRAEYITTYYETKFII